MEDLHSKGKTDPQQLTLIAPYPFIIGEINRMNYLKEYISGVPSM